MTELLGLRVAAKMVADFPTLFGLGVLKIPEPAVWILRREMIHTILVYIPNLSRFFVCLVGKLRSMNM